MKFKAYLRATLIFAAGFLLCVFDHFGIGMPLIMIGLFLFCLAPSAAPKKQAPESYGPRKPSSYPPVTGAPAADAYAYSGSPDRYFSALLRSCFPSFTIQENVSPANLGRPSASSWECTCGVANTGKFCTECGKPRPASSAQVVADPSCANLSFVLYRNGTPAAAVILCGKYEWDTEQIRCAMVACKKAKVPCLRFIKEFRNSADYVVGRINSVLR